MNQSTFKILENRNLAEKVFFMRLEGDTSTVTAPGQFVNIRIDGLYLRRPISVCDKDEKTIAIIYKTVGKGTLAMSLMQEGDELDILTGLGNGYDLSKAGERPVLLGGGAGVPPMFFLTKELIKLGKEVTVILGFNTESEVFFEEEFNQLGTETIVTTVDGSYGRKGFVTDALADMGYSFYYACGPEPMLRSVYKTGTTDGQLSFERRMGCGFGACMGCTCKTITGYKRICKEGPVMNREEIIWED
ncbi:MAG: dihydroorotate dehydrogenase electron transfer subunit [Lachnospiraceae bacterium]|nr:dihydroorotate dehydrogenase electron transfer subunit [Lachnospiraceae bacterium]